MIFQRTLFSAVIVLCLITPALHTATASQPEQSTLLLEIRNVPEKEQADGGRFANDEFREKKLVSLIRNNALFLSTPAEADALRRDGFSPTVLMQSDNLLDLYRRGLFGPSMKLPDCYHTNAQITARAAELAAAHPNILTPLIIGETTGTRRPIRAYRISADARAPRDKPVILFCAAIHSDEILGSEIVYTLLERLVAGRTGDRQIAQWLDAFDIYLIPVLNVDGHDMVTSGRDPRWRKNLRDVNGDGVIGVYPEGVDLNRGFDFNWSLGGSADPAAANYRGEAPFTESENCALRDFARDIRPLLVLSYHSQGEIIFYPWSWNGQPAPDDAVIKPLAIALGNSIRTMDGNSHYAHSPGGPSSQTYPWFYGRLGTIDLIVETGKGAHIMPPHEVAGIVEANINGVKTIFDRAAGPGLSVHVVDARDGTPLTAEVWLPAIENETVDRRHTNTRFGHLFRLLKPGEYRVIISRPGYRTEIFPALKINDGAWTELTVRMQPEQTQ